jgi:hypothetical protein
MSYFSGSLKSCTMNVRRVVVAAVILITAGVSTAGAQVLFSDDFDAYPNPVIVTNVGSTNAAPWIAKRFSVSTIRR